MESALPYFKQLVKVSKKDLTGLAVLFLTACCNKTFHRIGIRAYQMLNDHQIKP